MDSTNKIKNRIIDDIKIFLDNKENINTAYFRNKFIQTLILFLQEKIKFIEQFQILLTSRKWTIKFIVNIKTCDRWQKTRRANRLRKMSKIVVFKIVEWYHFYQFIWPAINKKISETVGLNIYMLISKIYCLQFKQEPYKYINIFRGGNNRLNYPQSW